MNPFTAVLFIIIGLTSFFSFNYTTLTTFKKRILFLTFLLIALSSLPRIMEAFSLQSSIKLDLIFFEDEINKYPLAPRMAPNTAICFLFISLAYCTYFRKRSFVAEIILLPVVALSGLAIVGYLYSEKNLMGFGPFYPMAFHTGFLFLMATVTILLMQPESRFMKVLIGKEIGAKIARRFIPLIILVPLALGYFRLQGERAGYFELEFGVAIITVFTIVIFFVFVWIYAKNLSIYESNFIKAQQEVKRKSKILDSILTNIPIALFHIDKDGFYQESMGKGLEGLGLKDNDLVGKNIHQVFADQSKVIEILKAESKPIIVPGSYNGIDYCFETYAFPDIISKNGVIGISLDITSKKQVERELQDAKEKAEWASKIKSRFLANMSHEIRTPINAIMGFAEMLHQQDLAKEQKEHLNNILTSGDVLLRLIGEVLDLNKIEEGKLTLDETTFNLSQIVAHSLNPYKASASKKGLSFKLLIDDNIPTYLKGDIHKIRQVIVNLVGNALKFTREGIIEVKCDLVNNVEIDQHAQIRISVSDTGIGVNKESHDRIFESFTQADATISKQYGGSGLGLSIVKQVVRFLGSEIHIVSPFQLQPNVGGNGTQFWFQLRLDISNEGMEEAALDDHKGIHFNSSKILIVDDNELNRKLATLMLKNTNCELSYAQNGLEAVLKLQAETFDLILMDIRMPVMDGIEATKIIRGNNNQVPIIALTANVYTDDIKHYESVGFSSYLSKPYTQKKLITMMCRFLKQSTINI